ncbi:MAG: hypothetical protein CSA70_07100 [Rhodobacterales bacterium]|nr:MAG: hypothetical protein CSA70_07100 [Rhodobacterales bacterium]
MAYASTTRHDTAHGAAHGFTALTQAIHGLVERFAKYRLYRRTLAELASVPTRELDDLGLSRTNLRMAAFEAVYGNRD